MIKILYTKSGLLVAKEFIRIVKNFYGKKYYEILSKNMIHTNIYIPENKKWKLDSNSVDFIEYRTLIDNVKIYFQIRSVIYATYKPNFFYISIKDIILNKQGTIVNYFYKKKMILK